jgi:hypothetical protein
MKNTIKLAALLLSALITLSLTGCPQPDDDSTLIDDGTTPSSGTPIAVTGVTLNRTSVTLTVGETETLTATVAPADAANKAVTWSTSNSAVATVSNRVITAVAPGSATITVTTQDGNRTAQCAVTVVNHAGTFENPVPLTEGVWANGYLATTNSEQWFEFTATADSQRFHFLEGTMQYITIQLYDEEGETTIGTSTTATPWGTFSAQTVTNGQTYRIKVTSYMSSYGAYKITFNASTTAPAMTIPATGVTTLTANTWADGSIARSAGEQWFKFTASATSHYIHFDPGTLYDINVQLYNSDGSNAGSQVQMRGTSLAVSMAVTSGQENYIKVTPYSVDYSGAYKIAFNTTYKPPAITLPSANVTTLTAADTWVNGTITEGGEQWFKFTATAATQYIHFEPGDLTDVYVMLYDNNGLPVEGTSNIPWLSYTPLSIYYYASKTVTNASEYYIKVWASDSEAAGGAYRLAFNTTTTPPAITLPSANVTTLTAADTWVNGSITTAGGGQWFKFTATSATQYIHFNPGEVILAVVQLYTNAGSTVGEPVILSTSSSSTSQTVTSGQEYYIKVTNYINTTGNYKIASNATDTAPPTVAIPSTDVTELTTVNTWVNGTITTGGEQWFKFTATDTTQYIHFQKGALDDVYVELFVIKGTEAINGSAIGSKTNLYGSNLSTPRTVTNGTEYYIKVTPFYGSGAFKIAFNTSTTAPS